MTVWRCRVCGTVADHDGEDKPPGWFRLNKCGDVRATYTDPTLGLLCSHACVLVSAMRPFGMTERQVRDWLGGAPVT